MTLIYFLLSYLLHFLITIGNRYLETIVSSACLLCRIPGHPTWWGSFISQPDGFSFIRSPGMLCYRGMDIRIPLFSFTSPIFCQLSWDAAVVLTLAIVVIWSWDLLHRSSISVVALGFWLIVSSCLDNVPPPSFLSPVMIFSFCSPLHDDQPM